MAESQQRLIRGLELPQAQPAFSNGSSSPGYTEQHRMRIALKLVYEFWGFCINSPDSVTEPGAMLNKSFPSGFESGSNLIDTGQDGVTQFDTPGVFFSNSITWTEEDHVGRYVVIWKPGEESPDDSIYRILRVININSVQIDRYGGGGTIQLGNKPTFSDRSGLYFRIVDIDRIGTIGGWSDGQGMILTFSGSSEVNTGQANSQVRLFFDSVSNRRFRLQVSPSGSWNGSTFSDGSSIITPDDQYTGTGEGESAFFYLAGSKDHLILYMQYDTETPSGFHIEVPRRLYPEENDPNPIMFMTWGQRDVSWENDNSSAPQDDTYGSSMFMVSHDGTTERYLPAARHPHSSITEFYTASDRTLWDNEGTNDAFEQPNASGDTQRYHEFEQNKGDQLVLSGDVVYYQEASTRFSFGRARARKVRVCHGNSPKGIRHGRQWVHVLNGVLLPWDNAFIPFGSFND